MTGRGRHDMTIVALALFVGAGANAATKYWVGGDATSPTLASVAANWADDATGTVATAAPAEGDDIVLDALASSRPLTWDLDVSVGSWTQGADYAGTVTFCTGRAETNLTHGVTSSDEKTRELRVTGDVALEGGTWTTPAQPSLTAADAAWQDGNGVYRLVARIGGTLNLAAAAAIDVSEKGFLTSQGPGLGSHGGSGEYFDWDTYVFTAANAYGSIKKPVTIGSGSDYGAGGGGIELEVTGAATVNGAIRADGVGSGHEDDSCSYKCGSAGGGIWIRAASLSGAGTVSAAQGYVMYGGGGGGRISVVLTGEGSTFAGWTGQFATTDNYIDWDNWYYPYCTSGTIYLEEAGLNGVGDLILKDGTHWDFDGEYWNEYISTTPMPTNNVEDAHFRDVYVTNGVMLAVHTGAVLRVDRQFITDSREIDEDNCWDSGYLYVMNNIILRGGEIDLRESDAITNCALHCFAPGSVLRTKNGAGVWHLRSGVLNAYYDLEVFGGLSVGAAPDGSGSYFGGELDVHGDLDVQSGTYLYVNKLLSVDGNMTLRTNVWVYTSYSGGNTTNPLYADYGYRLNITVAGDATIEAGGVLNANYCGYYQRMSALGYLSDENKLDGGSYGGCAAYTSGEKGTYGNPAEPTQLGAGGGDLSGGRGGGVIRLVVAGTLTVNGQIRANANNVTVATGAGAGSGGSIWITCSNLVGDASAKITANGGYSTCTTTTERRHGGGGRIAVHLTGDGDFSPFLGSFQAHGGFYTNDCVVSRQGGAGTVYLQKKDGTSTLIVDNGESARYPTRAATPEATPFTADLASRVYENLRVVNGAWLCPAAGVTLRVAGDFYGDGSVREPMGEAKAFGQPDVGAIAFVDATRTSVISGHPVFRDLVCDTPGKTIRFPTDGDSVPCVGPGGTLRIAGTAESPVALCSQTEGMAGRFVLENGGQTDVDHAQVAYVDSTGAGTVIAHTTTTLGAEVTNWTLFDAPGPGENTWTGTSSTNWSDAANWSLGRPPIDGDRVVIGASENAATLPCYAVYAGLVVNAGATLDLNSMDLCVTGDVSVAGALANGEASTLYLDGDEAVTVALNGATLGTVVVLCSSATFTDAFSADALAASAPATTNLAFGAGKTFTFGTITVAGAVDGAAGLAMNSTEPGKAWKVKVTTLADVSGVKISDSSVAAGSVALVGNRAPSVDGGGNSGWIFGNVTAVTGVLASNYVQAGLVANFDAIENAGAGQHDILPGEWINLAPSGCDNIEIPLGQYTFNEKSLVVKKTRLIGSNLLCAKQSTPIMLETYARANSVAGLSGKITFLTLGPRGSLAFDTRWEEWYSGLNKSHPSYLNSSSVYDYWRGKKVMDAIAYGYRTYSEVCPSKNSNMNLFMDGELQRFSFSMYWSTTAVSDAYGGVYFGNEGAEFEYGAVRVYSRELSAAEVAVNANVDQMRFKGKDASKLMWPAAFCWDDGRVRQRLTVTCDPRYGTVTVDGGEPQSGRIEIPYDVGTTPSFTLVATPSAGATGFFKWQGTGIESSTDATLTVSPSTNVTEVVALFRASDIHYVPTDFATPSAALASDDVKSNDTVYILDGTHAFAQVTDAKTSYSCIAAIRDKPITLTGSSRDRVILDCSGKGGLIVSNGYARVENVTIQNFMSSATAPALYMPAGTVTNCCIGSGWCSKAGSVSIIWMGEESLITDSDIHYISSSGQWTACRILYNGGGRVVRTVLHNNAAPTYNVLAEARNGKRPRFEHCQFQWNACNWTGVQGSNFDIIGCTFSEPVYFGHGGPGGTISTGGTCTIVDSVITGTRTTSGYIVNCNGTVCITNCLIARNAPPTYGVLQLNAGTRLEIVNSTIADNKTTAATYCGGISGDGSSANRAKVKIINSILWDNLANGVVKNFCDAYSYTDFAITNSCLTGMETPAEANNTADDPKFVDAGGMDYRLGDGSSCINTGLDAPTVTTDLDGKARPIDGIGYGEKKWDIGCYEADGPDVPLKATITAYGEYGVAPCSATQTVAVVGSCLTGLTYEWLAIHTSGGVVVTNRQETAVPENVFENLEAGRYTFVVIVRNDQDDAATDAATDTFRALADTTYASPTGGDQFPYVTPETAARSISVAASASCRRVIIARGTYLETAEEDAATGKDFFFADRIGLSFGGADDPGDVVIDCGGGGGLYLGSDSSRLTGVTFRNFMATTSSGQALNLSAGSASNVVFCGSGVNRPGPVAALYAGHNAVVDAAVVTNVFSTVSGGRAVQLVGGTLRRSLVTGNRCTASSVVSASKSSGGTCPRIEDCLVADNVSKGSSLFDMNNCVALRTTFTRNTSLNKSDNLFWMSNAALLEECVVTYNSAKAMVCTATSWDTGVATLRNCLFANNQNGAYATISPINEASQCRVENCTVASNTSLAGAAAGGVHCKSGYAQIFLVNSVVWGNTVNGAQGDVFLDTGIRVRSCYYTAFKEAATYPNRGNLGYAELRPDFRLTGRSKCHDAGTTDATYGLTKGWDIVNGNDLRGRPRLQGKGVDLGCYETQYAPGFGIMLR